MIKVYVRYLGVFLAAYLVALWFQGLFQTGEVTSGVELVAAWWVFLDGWVWIASAVTVVPLILLGLGITARQGESRATFIARAVVTGVVAGLASLEFWCVALQDSRAFLATIAVAPVAAFVGLAAAALAVRNIKIKPSSRRVAAAYAAIAVLAGCYRLVIPTVAPAFAYRYFDDSVSLPIAQRVLSSAHAGDSAAVLARRLPGFLPQSAVKGEPFTEMGLLGTINFRLVIRAGVIDTIEVTPVGAD